MRLASGFALAVVAAFPLLSSGPVSAERATIQPTKVVWPAPVGTRQPTQADIPPSLRNNEGARTKDQKTFDKNLQICRAC